MGAFESSAEPMNSDGREEAMGKLEEYEKRSVEVIEGDSRKLSKTHQGTAVFCESQTIGGREVFRVVPLANLSEVADDLIRGAVELSEYAGCVVPSKGIAEFSVRSGRLALRRVAERYDWTFESATCSHTFSPVAPTPRRVRADDTSKSIGFHVHSRKDKACVELSLMTPTGAFLSDPWPFPEIAIDVSGREFTLKVRVDPSVDHQEVERRATDIAARIIFELDVRNGIPLVLEPRRRMRVSFERTPESSRPAIRFPKLRTPREVAALFSFATEAADNPPYVFLSYYQVLEYYLPVAQRKDSIRILRSELRDPFFDEDSDPSVLRLINSIERFKQVGEEDQLKVLLRDYVREDKLKEFFAAEDMKHFSKNGPISGIPEINMHPKSDPLSVQAAKRVYALRNRIVHAKDDPRYAEIPVLLPRSAEATYLRPDISLARLLATETVIHSQE
ncbi:hypothetical protein [Streptomyces mirabilis]|uniref:hypothetical protein n=1 Tax=Streptomyces mirabilis TaxID=68239 RepID=UPI00365EEF7F